MKKEKYEGLKNKDLEYNIKIKNLKLKNDKLKKSSFYYGNKKKVKLEKQNKSLLNLNIKLKSENCLFRAESKYFNELKENKKKLLDEIEYYENTKNNVKNNYFEQTKIYSKDTKDPEYKKKIFDEIDLLMNYIKL
tara:strand:+ start:408 stop:812 length:405 start_codon:yes stop_codon:yes gene_type:complete